MKSKRTKPSTEFSFHLEALDQNEDEEQVMLNVRMDKSLYVAFRTLCDDRLKISVSSAIRQILSQAIANAGDLGVRRAEGIGRDSSIRRGIKKTR